jgi:AraC-like DNA-binding protein
MLHPHAGAQQFHLLRYPPAPDLALFVERFWIVQWDMRGCDPYLQTTLPHPCVNLVIEPERTGIYGVATQVFSYLLREQGRVFGIKFRPGGFYPFLKRPIVHLTDGAISIRDAFGADCTALVAAFAAQADAATLIDLSTACVRAHLPAPDATVTHINQIIDTIIADRTITRVDMVARQFGTTPRTLQRLFRQYVGVSPKWVIKRYRLHDAAVHLADGGSLDWPKLAVDLGYFDQAHFINDFKALIGTTPAAYAQQNDAPDQAISQRQ